MAVRGLTERVSVNRTAVNKHSGKVDGGWWSSRGLALCWISARCACWLNPFLLLLLPGVRQSPKRECFTSSVNISVSLVAAQYFASHCATRSGFLKAFPPSIGISEWIACYFSIWSVGSRPDNFSVFCRSR